MMTDIFVSVLTYCHLLCQFVQYQLQSAADWSCKVMITHLYSSHWWTWKISGEGKVVKKPDILRIAGCLRRRSLALWSWRVEPRNGKTTGLKFKSENEWRYIRRKYRRRKEGVCGGNYWNRGWMDYGSVSCIFYCPQHKTLRVIQLESFKGRALSDNSKERLWKTGVYSVIKIKIKYELPQHLTDSDVGILIDPVWELLPEDESPGRAGLRANYIRAGNWV